MLPKYHVLIGLIVSLVVYIIFPSLGIMPIISIFLSSILIDADHYLYYVMKKKNLSLSRAYKWFYEKRRRFASINPKDQAKFKAPILIFHGIEFILILSLLLFFNTENNCKLLPLGDRHLQADVRLFSVSQTPNKPLTLVGGNTQGVCDKLVFWILIGALIHLTADYYELFYFKRSIIIKMSQIYVYLTNKDKKEF